MECTLGPVCHIALQVYTSTALYSVALKLAVTLAFSAAGR